MEIGVPLGRRHQGGPDAPQGEGPAPQQVGHHGVQSPPEHQHAESGEGQGQQSSAQGGFISPLQGVHPPYHEQGGDRPAGEPLIDGQHLPVSAGDGHQLLAALGQQEHQGRKYGKDPEKSGPAAVSFPRHQFFSGTISIQ